jgi:hypothetical protein
MQTSYTLIWAPVLGWMTLLALVLVGYLVRLEIAEWRKNRRLNEKRAQLGLERSY